MSDQGYQGHEKPREQRLKERFKFNFQTKNKKKICELKEKTELRTKTWYVQNKCENKSLLANICKHEHENNMTKLWCKIVFKTGVEQIEGNEGS